MGGQVSGEASLSAAPSAPVVGAEEPSHTSLDEVKQRSESKLGKLAITGRYHKAPRELLDSYTVDEVVLGSGYNGHVFKAKSKIDPTKEFAVKSFKLFRVSKEKLAELENECELFLGMDHPHVVRLVDVFENARKLDLVMECATGGEVINRVRKRKRFTEQDAANTAYQMLLAISYIHSHSVVHRDIKLENFLYDTEDSDHVKLIDFGFSRHFNPNTKMHLSCGTLSYVAPEVLNKSYSYQCDMWSFGVGVFILLLGYMPFNCGSEQQQMSRIVQGTWVHREDRFATLSNGAKEFISKLLCVDVKQRYTAMQALEDPWIVSRHNEEKVDIDQTVVTALCNFGSASSFRRAAMSMMAWSMTNEERAEVQQLFLEIDKDKSGAISIQEFKKVLEDRFHVDDARCEETFHALDGSHMEEIHYSEFLAAMVSSRIAMHDDMLKQAFSRFDLDGSGFITRDELRVVLGASPGDKEIKKVMDTADTSHDGKISYDEWISFCHSSESEAPDGGSGIHPMHESMHKVIDDELKQRSSHRPMLRMKTLAAGLKDGLQHLEKSVSEVLNPSQVTVSEKTANASGEDGGQSRPASTIANVGDTPDDARANKKKCCAVM